MPLLKTGLPAAGVTATHLWCSTAVRAEETVQGPCFIGQGSRGNRSSPVFLRLAVQHAPCTTERQLKQFSPRERTHGNVVMHRVASRVTALETQAVARDVGGLKQAGLAGLLAHSMR